MPKHTILDHVNLTVDKGEIFGITGPNGAGKSILLKCLAGMLSYQKGEIIIDGKLLNKIPVLERKISIVFQEFVLNPHKTGHGNIAFPLTMKKNKIEPVQRDERIEKIAKLLHIDHDQILDRKPAKLSMGEKQRVAIGKALASFPDILLLDEPLSNIEESKRQEIHINLRKLIQDLGITAVYVSHNQREIGEMCSRIAVMNAGKIEQIGTYAELYDDPKKLFVSLHIGEKPVNHLDPEMVKKLSNGKIPYSLTIRPEECLLDEVKESLKISGRIIFIETLFAENKKILFIESGEELFGAQVSMDHTAEKGSEITIFIPIKKVRFFEPDTLERIYNLP